jgi:amino acid transporter
MLPNSTLSFILGCGCFDFQPISDFFSRSWNNLMSICFDYNVLVLFSTVLAGFISITVPVALSIVSKHTDEYKDKEISESFLDEPSYRIQVYIVPVLVVFALLCFGLKLTHGFFVYLILLSDIAAFGIFIRFLHIFGQYATNFDTYYSDKLKKDSDEIVQKENN